MLKEIIANKRTEVKEAKEEFPLSEFMDRLKKSGRNFAEAIKARSKSSGKNKFPVPSLIAEIKRASPSHGRLKAGLDLKETINVYNKYASSISVLTDKKFFNGSLEDLDYASRLTKLPILRKDFIIDKYQIYESRFHNADAILLVSSILGKNTMRRFINLSKSYGMQCLVEAHTESELKKALNSGAGIIGINNRDLETLKIDTEKTLSLAKLIPRNKIAVSESGIESREYVKSISGKVDAVLIGTYFMKSDNIEESIKSLIGKKFKAKP
jgi:indole-3-glycerol phosphate synthase